MKALIAMSGGVDSSVAAFLAKKEGYDCIGCTMKLYYNEDAGIAKGHTCCSLSDTEDARSVACRLGIPYYVFNFTSDFRDKVINKFICSYENGMTPNPCIDCNRYMKFDKLFQRAEILGCDYVVTGHYAKIEKGKNGFLLKKADDETKDQSYVLYSMTQKQLAHTLFPLGAMKKTETRRIADENGFVTANKADSQDICFAPDGDYAKVIEINSGKKPKPGFFTDTYGNILGKHKGIIHYTIGQRKGQGLSFDEPRYVCAIYPKENTVVLGSERELYGTSLVAAEFNWISGKAPEKPIRCNAKIRYRQHESPATASVNHDGTVSIVFVTPQRAITPGQAAVLYDGDAVLGGGVIQNRL